MIRCAVSEAESHADLSSSMVITIEALRTRPPVEARCLKQKVVGNEETD